MRTLLRKEIEAKWEKSSHRNVVAKTLGSFRDTGAVVLLVKMKKGSSIELHKHLSPSHLYVLSGQIDFGGHRIHRGAYIFIPANVRHAFRAVKESVFFEVLLGSEYPEPLR